MFVFTILNKFNYLFNIKTVRLRWCRRKQRTKKKFQQIPSHQCEIHWLVHFLCLHTYIAFFPAATAATAAVCHLNFCLETSIFGTFHFILPTFNVVWFSCWFIVFGMFSYLVFFVCICDCVCVCAQFVYIIYYWIVEIVVTVSFRTVVHLDSNALSLIIIIVNSRYKRNRHRIAAAQTIFNKKRICDRSNRNTQRSYSIQISEWVTENHINLLNTRQFISCLGKFKKHVLKQFWAANGCARERVPLLLMLPSFNELDIRIALTAIVCFNAKDSQLKILSIGE